MSIDSGSLIKSIGGALKKKSIDVMALGDPEVGAIVKHRIPTSSRMLNHILGGGIPCGRVTEIFGEESNGKSSLVADIMGQTQKMGGIAVIIDSEQSFSPERATAMGVDVDSVVYSDAVTVEEAFEVMDAVVREMGAVDQFVTIVWDSVAASPTKAELDSDIDTQAMASKARLLSKGIRRVLGKVQPKTALVLTNQVRTKFGVTFGKNTEAAGGFALRYAASVRLELQKVGQLKDKDIPVGIKCRAQTVKNKTCPPFKRAEFDMLFTGGIDDTTAILDLLITQEVVKQSGSWYQIAGYEKKFMRKDFADVMASFDANQQEALYTQAFSTL